MVSRNESSCVYLVKTVKSIAYGVSSEKKIAQDSSLGTCSLRRDSDASTSGLTILEAKILSKPITKLSVSVSL